MATGKLLGIYLNDHLALLVGGRELTKRMLAATEDDELRSFLEELRQQFESAEREVERLLRAAGSRPSPAKRAAAWAGEKAGRLKLNGNPTGYSPLTRLVELEGVRYLLESERMLWRSLERAGLGDDGTRFAARAEAAERLSERAEELRLVAADAALGSGGRRL